MATTQSLVTSTPSPSKTEPKAKKPGAIQSLFQKAAEKKKAEENLQKEEADGLASFSCPPLLAAPENFPTPVQKTVASNTAVSSFFQRKSLEKNTGDAVQAERVLQGSLDGSCSASVETKQTPTSLPEHSGFKDSREDFLTCERCGQEVLVWEMPEHTDYHFALDLQNSFSSSLTSSGHASTSNPLIVGTPQSSHGKSRSKTQAGPQPKRARTKESVGTLDSFFKKA